MLNFDVKTCSKLLRRNALYDHFDNVELSAHSDMYHSTNFHYFKLANLNALNLTAHYERDVDSMLTAQFHLEEEINQYIFSNPVPSALHRLPDDHIIIGVERTSDLLKDSKR